MGPYYYYSYIGETLSTFSTETDILQYLLNKKINEV